MAHAAGPWQGNKRVHSSIWSWAIILLFSLASALVPVLMSAQGQITKQLTDQPAKIRNREELWPLNRARQSCRYSSRTGSGRDVPALSRVWCENLRHLLQPLSLCLISFSCHQLSQHRSPSTGAGVSSLSWVLQVWGQQLWSLHGGDESAASCLCQAGPVRVLVCRQSLVRQNYFSSPVFSPE